MKQVIVGIDEAGRGPLAGPVVASAFVFLNTKYLIHNTYNLRDSKLLSPKQRELIYAQLSQNSQVEWGIGAVSEKQIDKINIFQATRLAMKKAVLALERKLQKRSENSLANKVRDRAFRLPVRIIDFLVIDGNMLLDLPIRQKAIVKADATILQCMAAGIVAKVTRDRLMLRLHKKYPRYGFDRHKGYGTPQHLEMLRVHGPSPIHRMSFNPCKQRE
ncbi:MAG TPA: ribonuclease HII [Candidatus Paceibacterota bacterium]